MQGITVKSIHTTLQACVFTVNVKVWTDLNLSK